MVLTRALFVNNEVYKPFVLNSRTQGISGKMNNLSKHHGAGPQRCGASRGAGPNAAASA